MKKLIALVIAVAVLMSLPAFSRRPRTRRSHGAFAVFNQILRRRHLPPRAAVASPPVVHTRRRPGLLRPAAFPAHALAPRHVVATSGLRSALPARPCEEGVVLRRSDASAGPAPRLASLIP
jgi:hypothetical protein